MVLRKSLRPEKLSSLILSLISDIFLFGFGTPTWLAYYTKGIYVVRVELNHGLDLCKVFYSYRMVNHGFIDLDKYSCIVKKLIAKKLFIRRVPSFRFISTDVTSKMLWL